jgi:hypothetical protein
MVSFDSDHSGGDGASLFFSQVSSCFLPLVFSFFVGGSGKSFLATLLISGVVDHPCGSLGSFACGLVGFRSLRFGVGFVGFYPKWWTINYSWNTSLC